LRTPFREFSTNSHNTEWSHTPALETGGHVRCRGSDRPLLQLPLRCPQPRTGPPAGRPAFWLPHLQPAEAAPQKHLCQSTTSYLPVLYRPSPSWTRTRTRTSHWGSAGNLEEIRKPLWGRSTHTTRAHTAVHAAGTRTHWRQMPSLSSFTQG